MENEAIDSSLIKQEPAIEIEEDNDYEYHREATQEVESSPNAILKIDPKRFKCAHCDKSYQHEYLLKQHVYRHTVSSPFTCEHCGEGFFEKILLDRHVRRTHSTDLKCEPCNKRYENTKVFNKHQFKFHWEKLSCPYCTVTYFTTKALEDHVSAEHEGKSLPQGESLKCLICNAQFVRKLKLLSHIESVHKMICGECNESFKSKTELQQHLLEQHHRDVLEFEEGPKRGESKSCQLVCYMCGHLFKNSYNLQLHFKKTHSTSEFKLEYKCIQCERVFDLRDDANKHFKTDHEGSVFKCEVCSKAYTRDYSLRAHLENTHPEYAPKQTFLQSVYGRCSLCHHESGSRALLLSHFKKKHRSTKLDFEYKCKDCEDFFKTTEEVKKHWKAVHDPNLFKTVYARCKQCGYKACSKQLLARHFKRQHPDLEFDVEYKCKDCEDYFKTPEDIGHHFIIVHEPNFAEPISSRNAGFEAMQCYRDEGDEDEDDDESGIPRQENLSDWQLLEPKTEILETEPDQPLSNMTSIPIYDPTVKVERDESYF